VTLFPDRRFAPQLVGEGQQKRARGCGPKLTRLYDRQVSHAIVHPFMLKQCLLADLADFSCLFSPLQCFVKFHADQTR